MSVCVFVLEQALSVRALQEMVSAKSPDTVSLYICVVITLRAIAAAQCIVIGLVCLWVCVCVCLCVRGWVCYHDNWILRLSILTKLGLLVKVVTVSR